MRVEDLRQRLARLHFFGSNTLRTNLKRRKGENEAPAPESWQSYVYPSSTIPGFAHPWAITGDLPRLPEEILLRLLDFLLYPDIFYLRLTCRYFYNLIPITDLPKHHRASMPIINAQRIAFFQQNPHTRRDFNCTPWYKHSHKCPILTAKKGEFPCYTCLQWLPGGLFSRYMNGASHSLGQWSYALRICVACGVQTGFYRKGVVLDGFGIVCLDCGELKDRHIGHFCRECAPTRDVYQLKYQWHLEEKRMKKYEKYLEGMRRGKEYRMKKGERLRKERGIEHEEKIRVQDMLALKMNEAPLLVGSLTGLVIHDEYPQYYRSIPPSA